MIADAGERGDAVAAAWSSGFEGACEREGAFSRRLGSGNGDDEWGVAGRVAGRQSTRLNLVPANMPAEGVESLSAEHTQTTSSAVCSRVCRRAARLRPAEDVANGERSDNERRPPPRCVHTQTIVHGSSTTIRSSTSLDCRRFFVFICVRARVLVTRDRGCGSSALPGLSTVGHFN